jgi:hypothetical protein
LYAYKFALLSFYEDPLVLPHLTGARTILQYLWGPLLVLPVAVLLIGIRARDRLLLVALAWLPVAFGPALFLEKFNAGRYYYLADVGAAMIWARGILAGYRATCRIPPSWLRITTAITGCAVLSYCAIANLATIRKLVHEQQADSDRTLELFRFVQTNRHAVPAHSVLWIHPPQDAMTGVEWGAREMTQFATGDTSLEAQVVGEPLSMPRRARLDGYKPIYLDMRHTPWQLQTTSW